MNCRLQVVARIFVGYVVFGSLTVEYLKKLSQVA